MTHQIEHPDLSVVIPIYRAQACLDELYRRLIVSLLSITEKFEVILVNDGCPENSWSKIQDIVKKDPRFHGINLSRNFGQHRAITAGLDVTKGEWIVVMDCDLQDQPEEICKLWKKIEEGDDVIFARRLRRNDSLFRKCGSFLFAKVLGYLTDTKQDPSTANFGIYHRRVIDSVNQMRENLRFFPLMVQWTGFRTSTIDVSHAQRADGKSSYSIFKLIKLAAEVAIAFSNKPLRLFVMFGFLLSFIAFLSALLVVVLTLKGIISVLGWPSLMVSIWFLAGLIIMTLGVVGLYIGKIFDETKKRPIYIIREKI
jgi:dolichol-phosphate mannosyltransferase